MLVPSQTPYSAARPNWYGRRQTIQGRRDEASSAPVSAPLADVDDVRLSTRWAFLTLIPASLASGDGPPPWQPPPIHSAADLPAAMAAALGDVCRFEPMFTGGLGGCKCKPDPDPTHLIPRPQCDPRPSREARPLIA